MSRSGLADDMGALGKRAQKIRAIIKDEEGEGTTEPKPAKKEKTPSKVSKQQIKPTVTKAKEEQNPKAIEREVKQVEPASQTGEFSRPTDLLNTRVPPEFSEALRDLMYQTRMTKQQLVHEALLLLFKKHGVKPRA